MIKAVVGNPSTNRADDMKQKGLTKLRWHTIISVSIVLIAVSSVNVRGAELETSVLYVGQITKTKKPLSLVEQIVTDGSYPGIQLAMNDNATTGTFLGHDYQLNKIVFPQDASARDIIDAVDQTSDPFVVVDLPAEQLIALVDGVRTTPRRLFFNVHDRSTSLREQNCRSNVLHTLPDRAMLADALTQYLVAKRWKKWLVVFGRQSNDMAYAEAIEASAKKYKAEIVSMDEWRFEYGGRLADSGHVTARQEVPSMTQGSGKEYDVIVVADEGDNFGEYMPYQTYLPRPVVGTQGLRATAWHRANELWGATQIQRRFSKLANGRFMTEQDYAAWAAGRSIGEAITRTNSTDVDIVREYLLGDQFQLAAFKGVPLNYRQWNGQLRQPILLAAPRMLISVSPQDGFLHQFNTLDTLGLDQPQTQCNAFN